MSRNVQTQGGHGLPARVQDVIALLIYDGNGNFSAQFMKNDRGASGSASAPDSAPAPNNSRTIGGYDAYFGKYVVDDESGTVTQTLLGSLAPENVGQVLTRWMSVEADQLTIRVDTATEEGRPAVLTLRWRRLT